MKTLLKLIFIIAVSGLAGWLIIQPLFRPLQSLREAVDNAISPNISMLDVKPSQSTMSSLQPAVKLTQRELQTELYTYISIDW